MFDAGPSLVTLLALGLGQPAPPPGELVLPAPELAPACVRLLSALYVGGPLQPCPDPPRPSGPLVVVPLDRPGHSASDE